ncbi:MAG: asparaginase domain-containing protein [Planctomycetaceae bacterium]
MRICLITAGGTIDKVYFDRLSEYQVGAPGVERILQELVVGFDYRIQSVLRKDSLDMTDADRLLLLDAVRAAPETHIVMTHGTDTMIETARLLLQVTGKRIVLTGAMQPANFRNSDAIFNVGMAVGVVQALQADGVWLAMSGRLFDPRRVRKDRERGVFVEDLSLDTGGPAKL